MGSHKGIWNEINENFVDDDRLMKGVLTKWEKEMVNLKHPKDQEALEVLTQVVLSKASGKTYGLRKLADKSAQIYQVYCQFSLESLPKNLIDDGIRRLLAKGLLI